MPITKSAKKEVRKSARNKKHNLARKKTMRESIKVVKKAVEVKDTKLAEMSVPAMQKAIDKAVKRGVIKKNAGARKKSRLIKMIKKAKV